MQKKTKKIMLFIIIIILLLLILLADNIIKQNNKNKLNLAQNSENELISTEPNKPTLSAGMIPVKWDGTNWIITTQNDTEWYDYKSGKPAYIMLNDGTYQSELIRNMEENGKKLASDNVGVGVHDDPSIRGTIFVWIPRFAYRWNEDNKTEIRYIKEEVQPGGEWTVLDTFSYTVADETKPDFSLSGMWVEKDVDTAYATKIAGMNQEEGEYGFISNTKASQVVGVNMAAIYFASDKEVCINPLLEITDVWNTNRIILKILNTNKVEPIKAKAKYNQETAKIEIQVTYNKNEIARIIDEDGNHLSENSTTANTGNKEFEIGKTYTYTIIDKFGNKKQVKCKPLNPIYAKDIIKDYYGKAVTNYICTNTGVSTWRIFHSDGNNIYLIADDYVAYDNLPKSSAGSALSKWGDYKTCFTYDILSDYTGSAWIRTNITADARKWLTWVNKYPSSTNNNIKAVAYMMDTKSWSSFKGEKAAYALGGPPLELFCASYKVTHPSKYILCSTASNGYQVKWNSDSSYSRYVAGLTKDDYDGIYIKSDRSKANEMYLASPSNEDTSFLMVALDCGQVSGTYSVCYGPTMGFRPIVCLKSGVGLLDNGNGTYSIQ